MTSTPPNSVDDQCPGQDLPGKRLQDLVPAEVGRSLDKAITRVRKTSSMVAVEFSLPVKGHEMFCEARLIPLHWKEIIVILRDITERTRAERRIHQYAEEVQEKNAELASALATAREATLLKGRFLANMSHEIRTPMNGVIGMTALVLQSDLTAEQRGYLDIVGSSADSLLVIINDILDFSKMEAGKLSLDPIEFDLAGKIDEIMQLLAPRAKEKKIRLAHSVAANVPARLIGDPGRWRQIVMNLVGNAIKFTEQGEVVVRVELGARHSDGDTLHVSVSDTGIGIAAEKQSAIFDSFSQADASTTRKFGGTGLGLSIASQLTRLMGGRIWVKSVPSIGSVFHVEIPFQLIPADSLPAVQISPSAQPEGFRPIRVLMAEDNAVNALLASILLKKAGHQVTHVVTGRKALDALALHEFDLILMDVQMPDMDGMEATGLIRRAEITTGRHIAIVAFTAHAMAEDRKRFLVAGADGYLTKPFSPDQLDAVIESLRAIIDEHTASFDRPASAA
jgi:signal transduction histidine kinase/ActR/RegA family two-component response regulator